MGSIIGERKRDVNRIVWAHRVSKGSTILSRIWLQNVFAYLGDLAGLSLDA
jgi:hypothetical protein